MNRPSRNANITNADNPESVFDLINRHAKQNPTAQYLIDPTNNESISYLELKQQVENIVALIQSHGLKQGEAVAFAMSNSPRSVVTILGIMYGGYLATALNLVAGNEVLVYVLEHSETKLILANENGANIVAPVLDKLDTAPPMLRVDLPVDEVGSYQSNHDVSPSLDALLMYTSGTTGRPKGVVLTQANLLAGGNNTALAHQLSPTDIGLCVLPLYHINGLCVTVMGALVSGGALVVPPKFSASNFWKIVIEKSCTWFSIVPTHISYLLHNETETPSGEALKSVRFGRSASAPLSPEVQEAFEERFCIPIIETMGLTETSAQILSNPLAPGVRKIGSPGIAFGNEVLIGDSNQKELPRGEEGEVLVRGPNVMRLYLKNEKATQQALTNDGWLRTGDLGNMDEDGYVFITGRLKELIIKGGENIAPREVDEALYTHSDIIEAAAFSVKCANYGETVMAAVTVSQGSSLTEHDLIKLCNEKLGAFKTPDRIHFLPELPKGPSGKIQRKKLAELLDT